MIFLNLHLSFTVWTVRSNDIVEEKQHQEKARRKKILSCLFFKVVSIMKKKCTPKQKELREERREERRERGEKREKKGHEALEEKRERNARKR